MATADHGTGLVLWIMAPPWPLHDGPSKRPPPNLIENLLLRTSQRMKVCAKTRGLFVVGPVRGSGRAWSFIAEGF